MSDVGGGAAQEAIYQALKTGLAPTKVYDHVPQDTSFPYVSIDAQDIVPRDHLASTMEERFVYLSIWSRHRGKKEVWQLIASIYDIVHRQRFAMDAGQMAICHVTRLGANNDLDGLTYIGTMTLKLITTP